MSTVHYKHCPVCDSTDIHPSFQAKDFTVSGEEFEVWQCNACTLSFTQDAPDAASIAPYYKSEAYISHTNTSKGFINALYQKVRKYTIGQKVRMIRSNTVASGHILDLGCGTGAFLNAMKESGWKATGLEPDEDARAKAKALYGLEPLPAEAFYGLTPYSFDAVTMWHVLEHVHELHGYIEQIKSLLNASGKLFVAVPNYSSHDANAYGAEWAAYDVPRHLYHFTPQSMKVLLQRHGMTIKEKKPMWFDSFYISMLSSKYKNGGTNWFGAPVTGMISNLKALGNKDKCSSVIYIIQKVSS